MAVGDEVAHSDEIVAVRAGTALRLWMLVASVVAFTVGDTCYIGFTSRGNYHPGDPIDIVYMIALLLLGVAAWPSKVRTGNVKDRVAPLALPITFALCTVSLLIVASQTPVPLVSILLAGATLVAVVARTLVSFRQIQTMAVHDALTDLPNRS